MIRCIYCPIKEIIDFPIEVSPGKFMLSLTEANTSRRVPGKYVGVLFVSDLLCCSGVIIDGPVIGSASPVSACANFPLIQPLFY